MPKWTDYTTKTTVADNDEIMTLDTAGKANKRLSLSTLSDWVLGKIADKVFKKLQTNDKTILGAINELNSNSKIPKTYYANIEASDKITYGENVDVTFVKVGRIVTVYTNVYAKSMLALTDFASICEVPDEYIPSHLIVVNYISQRGKPMLIQINNSRKKVEIYNNNSVTTEDWIMRQTISYISAT